MSAISGRGPIAQNQVIQEGEKNEAERIAPQGIGSAASTIVNATVANSAAKTSFLKRAALFVASPFIYLSGKIASALLFLPKKVYNFIVYLFTLSIPKQIERIKKELETNSFSIEKLKSRMENMDGKQEEFFDALLASKLLKPKDEVFLWNELNPKYKFSITILDDLVKHAATLQEDRAQVITSLKLSRQEILHLLDYAKYIFKDISTRQIGEIFYDFLEKLPVYDQIIQIIQCRKILEQNQLTCAVTGTMDQIKNTKPRKLLLLGVADSLSAYQFKNIIGTYFPLKIQNQIYLTVGQFEHLHRNYFNLLLSDDYYIELGQNSSDRSYFKRATDQVFALSALDSMRNVIHSSYLEDLREDMIS